MIEILNVGVAGNKMDFNGNIIEDEGKIGTIKVILYKQNDIENIVHLPEPDMNNFIPVEEVDNNKLIEWVEAHK